jgi:hypothetical protein
MYVLVAEARAAGSARTQLDVYYMSRSELAKPLAKWVQGDKSTCPSF